MFGVHRIKFYENGITSLNLPIAEQVLGARATRTTHPKTIAGLQKLLSLVGGTDFQVETPFFWKTKADVLESIRDVGHADLIKHAVSCSHVWSMTTLHTHCGCCSQCIDRRLAIFASDCVEHDPDEMYKTDVFTGQRSLENQDVVLAESYVRSMSGCANLTEMQFFGRFGELSRAIPYLPGKSDEVAGKLFQLYKHNAGQVQKALEKAVIHYAPLVVTEGLPELCLLRQLYGTKAFSAGASLPGDELISLTEAGELLGVDKGTISRYANDGKIIDNGERDRKRRVWKASVLLLKQKKEDGGYLHAARELRKDAGTIPDIH
jgi:hypothetical protein